MQCPGELPSPTNLARLVNLDNIRKAIGEPVTEVQKDDIIKDLEAAVKEFVEREVESEETAHILPFVTVNKKTNLVAIHSRLLLALKLSLVSSVHRLKIPPDSGAFDEVRLNIQSSTLIFPFSLIRVKLIAKKRSF